MSDSKKGPSEAEVPSQASDWIAEERLFLHDLSTPMTVALGMNDSALLRLQSDKTEEAIEKLHKVQQVLLKITDLITERRRTLVDRSETLES